MFVYILQAGEGGPVKIGFSSDLSQRISTLKTGVFEAMRVLRVVEGTRNTERWMQNYFSANHRRGEWYDFTVEMLTIVPPDPDTLAVDQAEKIEAHASLKLEMAQCMILAGGALPVTATTKDRIALAAERFGLTYRRARSLWYMSGAAAVRAHEADRIRLICRSMLAERADRLEAEAARVRSCLLKMEGASKRRAPAAQLELLRDATANGDSE